MEKSRLKKNESWKMDRLVYNLAASGNGIPRPTERTTKNSEIQKTKQNKKAGVGSSPNPWRWGQNKDCLTTQIPDPFLYTAELDKSPLSFVHSLERVAQSLGWQGCVTLKAEAQPLPCWVLECW